MSLKEKPSIYLVTRPSVDWESIADFFEEENVPPIPDSVRAGGAKCPEAQDGSF